jgi:putative ubiquitin-RnfH superfamily antitoxin RatB of RatAB toxin-antitoxin module
VPAADARIEVVYARPERQRIVELPFLDGMTARQAVEAAGLSAEFPEIAGRPLVLGVFGRRVEPEHVLAPGDRVEIYRPLPDDPKERRRRRAAAGGPARPRPAH